MTDISDIPAETARAMVMECIANDEGGLDDLHQLHLTRGTWTYADDSTIECWVWSAEFGDDETDEGELTGCIIDGVLYCDQDSAPEPTP